MQIRIDGSDLPGLSCGPGPDFPDGHHGVHVAIQKRANRDELLGLTPGDAESATWTLDCVADDKDGNADLKGAWVQGPRDARFIYLSWGVVSEAGNFTMFRRAKLWLNAVPADVLGSALESGVLVGRLRLTDDEGGPLCASVRPPAIEWSVG
jgi:Family of unknown function (DUF5990)